MQSYKLENWGVSIWAKGTQVGAAVGCWPAELAEYTRIPVWILSGRCFTATDLLGVA